MIQENKVMISSKHAERLRLLLKKVGRQCSSAAHDAGISLSLLVPDVLTPVLLCNQ